MSTLATRFAARSTTLRSDAPLSDDAIRAACPAIFGQAAHASRSARYALIPTAEVLAALRREGFAPHFATQARSRDPGRRGHAKHLLRLRHADHLGGDVVPEVILINSHDGSTRYQMLAGAFRFVCTNGLVCGEAIADVRLSHTGQAAQAVVEGAHAVVAAFGAVRASVEAMRARRLDAQAQAMLAQAALALRYGPGRHRPIEAAQLLVARRPEDTGDDLWTVLNRLQENAVRGGLPGRSAQGRAATTRAITGIERDVTLNRALWALAEARAALAA